MEKFVEIVSPDIMKKQDQYTIRKQEITSYELMIRAGKGLYNAINKYKLISNQDRVIILCGIGNNGGDGLVIYKELLDHGIDCSVFLVGNLEKQSLQAKEMLKNVDNKRIFRNQYEEFVSLTENCDVIIDSLLGIGIKGALRSPFLEYVNHVNMISKTVISIDIPSGVDALNGIVTNSAIKADYTFVVQNYKYGNLLNDVSDYSKNNIIVDVNILEVNSDNKCYLLPMEYYKNNYKKRVNNTHKYNYGNLMVFGGSNITLGAPILSGLAALRSGVGLVGCAYNKNDIKSIEINHPDLMIGMYDNIDEIDQFINKRNVIIFGPGLGRDNNLNLQILEKLINQNLNIIIDADGIYYLKKLLDKKLDLSKIIITPHIGEMSYLLDVTSEELNHNSVEMMKKFINKYDLTIILKGVTTLIGNKEKIFFNYFPNPGLAKAGTGDVLAGIVAAHVGRGHDNLTASCMAVLLHSICAENVIYEKGIESLIASDIINVIPNALKNIVSAME